MEEPTGRRVAKTSRVPLSPSVILSVCVEPSASVTVNEKLPADTD